MAKTTALIFGIIFLIVGILGLFPNSLVGVGGYFDTNIAVTIVELVTGLILLLVVSRSPSKSKATLNVLGIIYIILAILGFFVGQGLLLGFMANNGADNWLNLVLGVLMLISGLSTKDSSSASAM